jgi:hypothetical protein
MRGSQAAFPRWQAANGVSNLGSPMKKTKESPVRTSLRRIFIALSFLLAALPAFAHHSFTSEFDINQPIELKGTVTRFDWVNPHGWVYVDVKGDDGKVVNWAVETGGPNALLRRGVRKTDFPIGVEVTVKGWRAKNGTATANGKSITLADGRNFALGTSAGGQGDPNGGGQ